MDKSSIVTCEIANAIVMHLWVNDLLSTEEKDKIIEKNKLSFLC